MSDTLVCGIDIGSTNVKVLLLDAESRTVWARSVPVPRVVEPDGAVTDATALVATLERMIADGWRAAGRAQPLSAIAITGVGEDGIPVDAALRPLDRALPWFDPRARVEAVQLRAALGDDARAGVAIDFSRTAAKWRWLRDRRPAVLAPAAHWIALTDYPAAWWCRTPFMSETLAARTGCFDVFDRRWMPARLAACGAPPLPAVLTAGTIVGGVAPGPLVDSGAASGATRVVAGGHDHPVAATAVRRIDPAAMVDSLGTANLVYDEVPRFAPRADPFIAFSVPASGQPGVACLGVFEFAASLSTFREADAGAALTAFLAAEQAPGVPGSTEDIARALACTVLPGSARSHAAPPTLRAVLEANGFYARRMREAIVAAGSTSSRIYAVGGWARSRALMALRASIFGEPVFTIGEDETTALGAALLAADAVDGRPRTLRRDVRRVDPRPDWQAVYERAWPALRERLHELKNDVAA